LLYQDEVHGDLFTQVDKTMDLLLTKYLKAGISYDGLQRLEEFPLPESALREALINAVAHKNYASAVPIQISVYDDKLMIWNSGQLPVDWSVDKLFSKHESQPYNPDVANTFFRAAYMESWGRGFEKIAEACEKTGACLPIVRHEHTGLWIEFPFKDFVVTPPEAPLETPPETPPETPKAIIIELRKQPSLTLVEVAGNIGKSVSAVKRAVKKLIEDGRLRRLGSKKGGCWEVDEDESR